VFSPNVFPIEEVFVLVRIVTAILAFYIIALLLPQMAVAQVYSYIDKDGVMVFTSKKPDATRYEVKDHGCFGVCRTGVNWANTPLKPQAYAQEVKHAVDAFGVDEALVRAIMHAESWFEVDALSSAGAQGLMQLMPATQKRFGVSDPYNSMQNITAGVQYLAWLMNEFNHDTNYVVAAYNAGENAVKRHQGVPPFSETQEYLRRVNILYKRYRDVL
jgi:soluble lytic murein transglycosylase-like protein